MLCPSTERRAATARDLLFVSSPQLWAHWPVLPVVRHQPAGDDECGVLYDFAHTSGRTGYQVTVFRANIFLLPATEAELVQLPKEVFDTFEELLAAGWRVD